MVKKIVLIGNCQVLILKQFIELMVPDIEVNAYEMTLDLNEKLQSDNIDYTPFAECDLILSHYPDVSYFNELDNWRDWIDILQNKIPNISEKIKYIPYIYFSGFHPDCCYASNNETKTSVGVIPYNSSIVLSAWKNNLTPEQTYDLFNEDVFKFLNFEKYWEVSVEFLKNQFLKTSLPFDNIIENWSSKGIWMYTINHPKNFVLHDVAKLLLERENIQIINQDVELDVDLGYIEWFVYDDLLKQLPIKIACNTFDKVKFLEYIHKQYNDYNQYDKQVITCNRLETQAFKSFKNYLTNRDSKNPYKNLPDYRFWRRSIEKVPMEHVNPLGNFKFNIKKTDKLSTAGSCLSQRLSICLKKNGYNFYVTEKNTDGAEECFSARYGNVYTAKQLNQLFDRAFETFIPQEKYWINDKGKFVDPFRPQINPDGFNTIDELEQDRVNHLRATKYMFETTDVFVVTLGLTEAWKSKIDGAIFPIAPGIVAGELNETHEFVNLDVVQNITDLQNFVDKLTKVNPNIKIIMTVSPQPPIATYEEEHILTAATYTKSVLRVAVGEICKLNKNCDYFPSYEIIVGNFSKSIYFENDLRSITQDGVDRVMSLFLRHYSGTELHNMIGVLTKQYEEIMSTIISESHILCDEDQIDKT